MARKATALKAVETAPVSVAVGSWDEIDERMLEIGRKDLEIAALDAQLQERILMAGADLMPKIKRLQEERGGLAGGVVEFAVEHRADVDGKTWKGAFGKLTWPNESSAVVLLVEEETVIKKLKGQGLEHCVRHVESVDKEALRALTGVDAKKLGFRVETKNAAGEETDPPKLSIDKKKVQKHDSQAPTGSARKRAR